VDTENKTELRTFRFRVKDKQSGKRRTAAADAVDVVWNHCNGAQVRTIKSGRLKTGSKRRPLALESCSEFRPRRFKAYVKSTLIASA
jgi:hypothetical protein